MTICELLTRLAGVKKSRTGWVARCPGHDDRQPSLAIAEKDKRILLYCRAGCTTAAVCASLGLTLADLFHDQHDQPSRHASRSVPRPERPEEVESRLWSHALGLRLRALAVLDAATDCHTEGWLDTDFDLAIQCVTCAYDDLRQADVCDKLAFALRCEMLTGRRVAA